VLGSRRLAAIYNYLSDPEAEDADALRCEGGRGSEGGEGGGAEVGTRESARRVEECASRVQQGASQESASILMQTDTKKAENDGCHAPAHARAWTAADVGAAAGVAVCGGGAGEGSDDTQGCAAGGVSHSGAAADACSVACVAIAGEGAGGVTEKSVEECEGKGQQGEEGGGDVGSDGAHKGVLGAEVGAIETSDTVTS